MKQKGTLISLFIVILLLYFLTQTAADAFMSFSTSKSIDVGFLRKAAFIHPLGAEPHVMMGYALLEQGHSSNQIEYLQQAAAHFKRAISLNPFIYQAHLNLGKTYFLMARNDSQLVSEGILSFKRAATIRGANIDVAMDTARLYFSLWPLLKAQDQLFCKKLILGVLPRLGQKDFSDLVGLWALYNRKIAIMEEFISQRPDFSYMVANALTLNRQFNKERRQLLNTQDEINFLSLKRKVEEELNQAPQMQSLKQLQKLFKDLGQVYRQYDRLAGQEKFPNKTRLDLRRRLGERLLQILIDGEGNWRKSAKSRQPVDSVVSEMIQDAVIFENFFELEAFLDKCGYYMEGDIKSFLAHQRIFFLTSRYDQVIDQIETLQRQMTFIREDARGDMILALFLLTDAYRYSRLLTMSTKVIETLQAMNAPEEQLTWQRYMIEKVIAVEEDTSLVETWRSRFAMSRTILLDKAKLRKAAFLDEDRKITVSLSQDLWDKGIEGSYNLLEIFVDGCIVWDGYLGQENFFSIVMPESYEGRQVQLDIILR